MGNFVVYTDGACINNVTNAGFGGWAFFILGEDLKEPHKGSGAEGKTTNNRMEILAVVKALELIDLLPFGPHTVTVYCDNTYVTDSASDWIYNWEKRGWKFKGKRKKQEIKHLDLWKKIFDLNKKHKILYRWVRGHSGDYWNERCDLVAELMADQLQDRLRDL